MAGNSNTTGTTRSSRSGYRHRRVRDANALPLGWRHLTRVDVERLKSTVDAQTVPGAKLPTLEACLLLWSSLMTGRHPAKLLTMSVRLVAKGANLQTQEEGLIRRSGRWGWWLAVDGPHKKEAVGPMCPTSDFIYLPATDRIASLVKRCVALRRSIPAAPFNISGATQPLFSSGVPLLSELTKLLAARHAVSPDRARRATTTPETLTRWLPGELVGLPGGDPVAAGLISGSVEDPAVTPSHYGAVSHSSAVEQYSMAVTAIDTVSRVDVPGQLLTSFIGDRMTPTDRAVRDMTRSLARALEDRALDLAERHRAMTKYTLALLAFAFAHRGTIEMPSLARVHPTGHFCWIVDKILPAGRSVPRMVWVCASALQQLHFYEEHVDLVCAKVSRRAARAIDDIRSRHDHQKTIALFDLADSGDVKEITLAAGIRDAMSGFGLRPNAGRHWLRAKLIGICSSETLYAFYGHGPLDDSSWDASSTLDPAIYRADLAAALDPVLAGVGWAPRMTFSS
jgi:hypothetical protein